MRVDTDWLREFGSALMMTFVAAPLLR